MSKKFWLEQIQLHTSPGFSYGTFPPVEKLGEHLNVIWGPNAVGKSTLTRAMRCLIWDTRYSNAIEAEGIMWTPDSEWSLILAKGKLIQTRLNDNQRLLLPGRNDELSESYWFTLHELLQEDERSTEAFLRQVRTSMQGGVDLAFASQQAGGTHSFSSGNIAQAKLVRERAEHLKQVYAKQAEHQGIQERIESLEQEVHQGPALSEKKGLIEDARMLMELAKTIEAQGQELSLYPPSIALINPGSHKRLQELVSGRQKALDEHKSCIQTRERLDTLFTGCAIAEEDLQDVEKPARVANRFASYKDALDAKNRAEREWGSANESLLEWEREHSWLVGDSVKEKTLRGYVDSLKELALGCEPLRCEFASAKRLLDELGEPETIAHQGQELTLLQVRLSDWIGSYWNVHGRAEHKGMKPGARTWLVLLSLGIGALTSFLSIAIHPVFSVLGAALVLLSVVLLVPSPRKNSAYRQAEKTLLQAQQEAKELCNQLGIESPSAWEPESCHRMIASLGSEIASIQRIEQVNLRRKVATDHLEKAREKLQAWTSDWQQAAKAIGLKGDEALLEGSQFFHFAERLLSWSRFRLKTVTTQEALTAVQKETSDALSLLQEELETDEAEVTFLQAKCDTLIKRFNEALALQDKIAENSVRMHTAQQELLASDKALEEFYQSLGLEYGNEQGVADLVSSLPEWTDLVYSLQHNRNLYEQKCKEAPIALEMATQSTPGYLSDALARITQDLKSLEEKRETLGGLRSTFETVMFGSDLGCALQKKELAIEMLQTFREDQVMAMMIDSLAGELKQESEELFQPQVLKLASSWLSDITSHRYTLSANNEEFFATDTIMAKNYHLDELSSGTRIQLLFSIRMAFITMQEETSGVCLPIFLDELLANSDDDRALAITQAIGNIAKGRQVFYVTAQRDEVEKLKTLASSEVAVIALEDLRRDFRVSKDPLKKYVYDRKEVPVAQEDYQTYGKILSVAGASLWGSVEALHSWHLLANSEQLFAYLQQGLKHIGQLISAKSDQEPSLALRLTLLKAAQHKAQQGRAKKVQLSDLEDPALALNREANFWNQIEEVVGPEGCTGNALLEAIQEKRIKRLSEANLDLLSTWLYENRFVTDKESKNAQSILENLFVEFDALTVGSDEEKIVGRYLDAVIG